MLKKCSGSARKQKIRLWFPGIQYEKKQAYVKYNKLLLLTHSFILQ